MRKAKQLPFAKPKRKTNWEKRAWDIFSLYIRQRNICEFHQRLAQRGIPFPCKCAGVLQCCHKISRSKKAIKFDKRNVFCGCAGSNTWSIFNQLAWEELWKKLWSEDVKYLEQRRHEKYHKRTDWTYAVMIDELKAEMK